MAGINFFLTWWNTSELQAPVDFYSIPIKPDLDFYFLSFAIDSDPSGKSHNTLCRDYYFLLIFAIDSKPSRKLQNGKFSPYCSSLLTKVSASSIKKQHPLLNYSRSPLPVEHRRPCGSPTDFTYCVGELITTMKNHSLIKVTTIAPFANTPDAYIELFNRYKSTINYVNYQFSTDGLGTPRGILDKFKVRASQFDKNKLLPSCEINGRGIHGEWGCILISVEIDSEEWVPYQRIDGILC
ncbi:hypothetical protein MLD38_018199 [Melastoma candidum]|uniref:Uncharacterized protein n=1 Tax=Melastoma candidum TaxID=119954 RepID=A0ACB9QT10_9MYRT|nr:hypothetical protein MLD38_018199 [Melastoma candidum]